MVRTLTVVALASAVLLASSGLAYGHKVYQGADVTNTWYQDYYLRVCDGERDGNVVRGEASNIKFEYLGTIYDKSGANDGRCGNGNMGKIGYHQTCELDGGFRPSCSRYIREPW